MGQIQTIKARLKACRKSEYTAYVFEDLTNIGEFVLCTLLPNWEHGEVEVGQEGFLAFKKVVAGETWLCPKTLSRLTYKYSAIYFDDFVPLTHIVDGNRVQELNAITIS